MSAGYPTNVYMHGFTYEEISDLLYAFKARGVDHIKEMTAMIDDPDSAAMELRAKALTAEAKLNRIKNLLKD